MVLLLRTVHRFLFHLPVRWLLKIEIEVFFTRKFNLTAVINHSGTLNSGYYTCVVKDGETWWHCNDEAVVPVNIDDINKSLLHVLFLSGYIIFIYVCARILLAAKISREGVCLIVTK